MSVFKRKNRRLLILFAVAFAAAAIVPVAEAAKRSTNTEQLAGWGWRPTSGKLSPTSAQYLVRNRAALEAYEHRYLPASKPAATSSVRIITENSASQNQIALRNAAVTAAAEQAGAAAAVILAGGSIQEAAAAEQAAGAPPEVVQALAAIPSVTPTGREMAPTYAAPLIVDNSLNPNQTSSSGQPVRFSSENSASQNEVALRNAAETTISTPGSSVFDWGDAGLGAGSAVGLMLLTAAAAFVIRRSRPRRVVL